MLRLYNCKIYAYIYIIMELGRIFVRINLRNGPKNSQQTWKKLLSAVQRATLTGISIVSLQNEGFATFCLCLTTGRHLLVLWRNYGIREADGCSQTPPGAMLWWPFSYRRSFMYGCEWFKLYSGKRCILGERKRLSGETAGLQYLVWLLHNIDRCKQRARWVNGPITYWVRS